MNKTYKQFLKPLYHISIVFILFSIFSLLNIFNVIDAETNAPIGLESTFEFIFSYRFLLSLFLSAILSLCLFLKYRKFIIAKKIFGKLIIFFVGLVTGKFYTWGAFFFAWAITSNFVEYVKPFPFAYIYGILSIIIGYGIWILYCSIAVFLFRRRNFNI